MSRRLSSLHARAICHATEDSGKVEQALRTVVGDATVARSNSQGHFGNLIELIEATLDDEDDITDALKRMPEKDLEEIASTLDIRIDDACHVYLRLDKQRAYAGELRLAEGDDVIAVRIKVRAFPAKPTIAAEIMETVLKECIPSTDDAANRDR